MQPSEKIKFREGEIVWIDDPGVPYQDWNGASCIVENPKAGDRGRYVAVRLAIPFPPSGSFTALFHSDDVKRETRPWLKKHLRKFITLRDGLLKTAERINEEYQ